MQEKCFPSQFIHRESEEARDKNVDTRNETWSGRHCHESSHDLSYSTLFLTPTLVQLLVCRLLPANIFNLLFTRGFSEECYSFSVGFLFYEEGSPLPAKIF